jgi:DNA-binding CsgD family transcriptional regulator/PAS domain-containing protein
MHFRALSELIGSIYNTVVDPSACPTMLNGLADLLGATGGAQVGAYNSKAHSVAMLAPRVDPKELTRFSQYWANVWRQCDKHPIGAVVVPEMRISDPDHCRPDIFNGSSKPHGPERMMGATLLTEGSVSTVVSVSRPYPEGEFDAAQIQLFAALIPHLQRAVQLRLRLATLDGQPTSAAEMLNRLPHAVLLVDAGARVIFANQAATRILGGGNGLSLDPDGLKAETTEDTRRLRQTIADYAEPASELGGGGGRFQLSRRDRGPLTVLLIRHRTQVTWTDILRPTAILFVTEAEQAAVLRSERFSHDFGLTRAEAVFAVEISKGDGLQATASRLGVSLTTVRTHLAHVFDKTGTRRQAELVRLMLQGQPATGDD